MADITEQIAEVEKSLRELPHHKGTDRSEEHTSELQSPDHLVCRLLLEKKKKQSKKVFGNSARSRVWTNLQRRHYRYMCRLSAQVVMICRLIEGYSRVDDRERLSGHGDC